MNENMLVPDASIEMGVFLFILTWITFNIEYPYWIFNKKSTEIRRILLSFVDRCIDIYLEEKGYERRDQLTDNERLELTERIWDIWLELSNQK